MSVILYGILECSSKSRVCGNGIPFKSYLLDQKNHIVSSKKYTGTHTDVWVKVIEKNGTLELCEVIGPVYCYEHELTLLRKVYGIYWKYPVVPKVIPKVIPGETLGEKKKEPIQIDFYAFTVDGETTTDRDDAISVETTDEKIVIGIHITDVTCYPELFALSKEIVSSAYWEKGSMHMLPPTIPLSLDKGNNYPCISLRLTYSKKDLSLLDELLIPSTTVFIKDNFTYETFIPDPVLEDISGSTENTDIISFFMVQYNLYIARHVRGVVYRVQETPDTRAYYSFDRLSHSYFTSYYAHGTSPMRRFIDMHNQYVIKGKQVESIDLEKINLRMNEIAEFHHRETVMSLSYQCKNVPVTVEASIEVIEENRMLRVTMMGKRIKIPLSDTFYAEPICDRLVNGKVYRVELFGLHKHGKATLRLRLV